MTELLRGIIASLQQTTESVADALREPPEAPDLVRELVAKAGPIEGMSLLSLKNSALLGYINSIALVLLAHLERLEGDADALKHKAVLLSIEHRVCLEKGVKPLEKKLAYQLDKMVRSYHRMEENQAKEEVEQAESDSGSDSDDDALNYRPDASAFASAEPKNKQSDTYQPPKISAAAPPSARKEERPVRKLQSMEEYLAEQSEAPVLEHSIGSTIVDSGRGGVTTSFDRAKEREIQRYEEDNFTRLPSTATKRSFKQKMADRANTFAGEDWLMFSNTREVKDSVLRKRKSGSAWDRAKRKK